MRDQRGRLSAEPFTYQATKQGAVLLRHQGKVVKTLSGQAAARFLQRAMQLDAAALQLLLARETGQFKFGNEHAAALAQR